MSAPTRGPWIEIFHGFVLIQRFPSAPTRGPWIEILEDLDALYQEDVGPHTGAVD